MILYRRLHVFLPALAHHLHCADVRPCCLGLIGLNNVYKLDATTGNFLGLEEISSKLAPAIPNCPHCKRPIRQYATRRYNLLINGAVIDEMTKRFITTGQTELQEVETIFVDVEKDLENTRPDVTNGFSPALLTTARTGAIAEMAKILETRYKKAAQLRSAVTQLQRRASARHQPAHKLHEATIHAIRKREPIESELAKLELGNAIVSRERDHRITLAAKMMEIKIDCITMEDKLRVVSAARARCGDDVASLTFPMGSPQASTDFVLNGCADFITQCSERALPRLVVEASLYYARITRMWRTTETHEREMACQYLDKAKALLEEAQTLCVEGFRDAETLSRAVSESLKLLRREWYGEVTSEEIETIKRAMVGGPRGITTHSGHWYNCSNGHPVRKTSCYGVLHQTSANQRVIVCYWRVRYAHGARTLSRTGCQDRRTESSDRAGCEPSDEHGAVRLLSCYLGIWRALLVL